MKPGDRVRLLCRDGEVVEGILMPEQVDAVVVKLDSGYNVGVDKKRVKSVEAQKARAVKKRVHKKVPPRKDLPTIAILHTGGTIASKVDYETGAVSARFSPEDIVDQFPQLRTVANVSSQLLSNMWSEDMRFGHYNVMAKAVHKAVKAGVAGVIITHGTDTLHYSSAALAFALENVPVPVVLVGAQRSSDRPGSDAGLNLVAAARFTVEGVPGVFVAMHEHARDETVQIIEGVHARKMHASRRDAFVSVNAPIVCRVHASGGIDWVRRLPQKASGEFVLRLFEEKVKVAILKVHPNMVHAQFDALAGFDGVVIEGTGLGHAPINAVDALTTEHKRIASSVKRLCLKSVVAMATQTVFGRVNLNVYSSGRQLQGLGVVGHLSSMHAETAFVKLAWLLSNFSKDEARGLFGVNLRGEVVDREELLEW